MKKYVKPELLYESFVLSEQIAVGCSSNLIANLRSDMDCSISIGEAPALFAEANGACVLHKLEGYCYHNGNENFTIFSS